jgi:O-antigen ligase
VPRATTPATRVLDLSLLALPAACLVQAIPMPRALVGLVSPARVRLDDLLRLGAPPAWLPLSVSAGDTLYAAAVLVGAVLVYWSARHHLASGGLRHLCRGISWIGLALACVAIAQRGMSFGRIYGFWEPLETGATPYGPFVNRNHAATWLLLALPVSLGYLLARLRERMPHARPSVAIRRSLDARAAWLLIATATMVLALALSLSRSGIVAFAIAAGFIVLSARRRFDSVKRGWLAATAAAAVVGVLTFADVSAVVLRFSEAVVPGGVGRSAIWRDTLPLARDFALTGCGAGTYEIAMRGYQTGDRRYYYNQAHNHFLQVAAEGGLLLIVPLSVAALAFAALARRRLRADTSGVFWIRAGAAAGLVGVAVQSMWETGLTIPANALLAAVAAAILTHQPSQARAIPEGGRGSACP